jgi:integrase/recombinase XerD
MENTIRRFFTHLVDAQGCTENTILAYQADLQQLNRVLGVSLGEPTSLEMLEPEHLQGYVTWLLQQGYQPATISRKMAAVRSFLKYVNKYEGIVTPQLSERLHYPPSPRKRPNVLSNEEVTALLAAPSKLDNPRILRDRAILFFISATGFRASDVVNLQLKDVNFVEEVVFRPPAREHFVPLGAASEPMRQYLENGRPHLARNPLVRAFFINQRGQSLSRQGLWLVVKRWAVVAGLGGEISPHTLRHTLAQNMLNQGKSRKEVQQFLGLSSPNAIWFRDDGSNELE